jgi:hypothetical protein
MAHGILSWAYWDNQMSGLGHVTRIGEMRNARTILVGISDRKKPLGDLDIDGEN